jgi:hypothetical protein
MNNYLQRKFGTLGLAKLLHATSMGTALITVMVFVAILAGCGPTKQELAVRDMSECRSYGFKPGTDGFAQCRFGKDVDRSRENQRRAEVVAEGFRRGMNDIAEGQRRAAQAYRPINCTTLGVHTTCY